MPLKKCTNDGKSGWKWGDAGHCYTGPNARKDAMKQAYMIERDKWKSMINAGLKDGSLEKTEVVQVATELNISILEIVDLTL